MRNERKHIERSIRSALKITPYVFVVDSQSNDGSIELAERSGARVFQYEWTSSSNFSTKMNWALNNLPIETTWAIRLDADEYFMEDCIDNLENELKKVQDNVNGLTLIRRIYFLGRWMKHSNEYPKTSMRIFRVGKVRMETRWLDEHVDVGNGIALDLPYNLIDDSQISLNEWVAKHNSYSNMEAVELINQEISLFVREKNHLDKNAQKKKQDKNKYSKMPKYWRAFFFFCYRYFYKLGILDGKEGFLWNFFQCWWYRNLADAKVDEIYRNCGKDKLKITNYIKENFGLDISQE